MVENSLFIKNELKGLKSKEKIDFEACPMLSDGNH